jgi:peptide/nickel transport system permease protein
MLLASLLIANFLLSRGMYLTPGSPVAALSDGRSLPEQSAPRSAVFAQYWYWLDNVLYCNLGISITLRENVWTLIASRIWTMAHFACCLTDDLNWQG